MGTLLGVACGDILGSQVEGTEAQIIAGTHTNTGGRVVDFLEVLEGKYTDDTQMTIALADSLVESKGISLEHVANKYNEYFQPHRGYADASITALNAIAQGLGWEVTGRVAYREGSFGSGASMRIAPLGIAYRNASDDVLHKAVVDAVLCTHTHPQSVDGGFVQAKAVSVLVKTDPASFAGPLPLLETLLACARTDVIRGTIQKVINQVKRYEANPSDTTLSATTGDDVIGNGVAAPDAIGSSLLMFSRYWKTPEDAIINAVALGGDTDTIAAHTGALVGALHGNKWIPQRWYDKIENDKQGRDFIIDLAKKLATLDCTTCEGKGEQILKDQDELIAKGGEFAFEQERNQQVRQMLTKIDSKLNLLRINSKENVSQNP